MAAKNSNLYLFLALACFVGIILIFIFDGYIGVYDQLVMENGQYKQTVEGDQWAQQEKYGGFVSVGVDRSGRVDFTYTVQNHRFSPYADNLEVSLWYNRVKTRDLLTRQLSIPAFDNEVVTWSVNVTEVMPTGFSTDQNFNINLKIIRGSIERDVVVNIYPMQTTIKTIPVPAP